LDFILTSCDLDWGVASFSGDVDLDFDLFFGDIDRDRDLELKQK